MYRLAKFLTCLATFMSSNYVVLSQPKETKSWSITIREVGTNSSPRAIDLNKDGTLDIVIGAGKKEFEYCNFAVMAFDGANGNMLWKVSARDQIFGSDRDSIGDR